MTTIVEQLLHNGVLFGVAADDWRDLTRQYGEALTERGFATAAYSAAMIANVEENGPYLVIAPGVALLHARPEDGTLQNAVVVGTAEPPIAFGHSTNDPVWLVLALSATGDLEHTRLLRGIAMMLAQEGALDRLRRASTEEAFIAELELLEHQLGGASGS